MGLYYEDFHVGDEWETPGRTVTETDVVEFAQLSGDFNPLHTDRVFAAGTPFGQPIAHGLLALSMATGLMARLGIFDGTVLAFLSIEQWDFKRPIFFGDTIKVHLQIESMRTTRDGLRGILRRRVSVVNQRNEIVQDGILTTMVRRKEDAPHDA
ncbi:MAG TPA: dehydratase [Sulfobacillus sp.]|nr:dehydratase [Sulfobacillus sp.]